MLDADRDANHLRQDTTGPLLLLRELLVRGGGRVDDQLETGRVLNEVLLIKTIKSATHSLGVTDVGAGNGEGVR